MMMTDRERFVATMHYQPRDRAPICDFGFWPETIVEWHKQGLPRNVTFERDYNAIHTDRFFGMDAYTGGPGVSVMLRPPFEVKVIEDQGDHEIIQQADGVRVLRKKYMSSIPHHVAHLLTDRESWRKYYKPRLDPDTPERYPADWSQVLAVWNDTTRPHPVVLNGGSLFGWIRDWMGLENVAMVIYDDPAWFQEMVTTIADCVVTVLGRAFEKGGVIDAISFWEDMCYNAGPLISPEHFKRFLVPQYQRITGLARKYGVDVAWVDCDGCIDALIPLWLEGGVNCMFPVEVGTWGADPIKYRKQYGKQLLMMGGFDKHILARGPREIEKEVDRLTPLVEEGGYIGFCDHRVPPDVPLANYMHYLRCVRERWGRGVNLKPMGEEVRHGGERRSDGATKGEEGARLSSATTDHRTNDPTTDHGQLTTDNHTMTSRERMLTALARGKPDRLPITVHQWQPYHRNRFMNGMTQFQAFRHVGMDASITLWQGVQREPSPNWIQTSEDLGPRDGETYTRHRALTPEGEITWMTAANQTTSYIAEPLIKTEGDAELFLKYLPRCTLDKRLVTEWHDMTGDDGILRGGVAGFVQGGPWQDFCAIAGTQEAIFWAMDNPAFVHHFLEGLTRQRIEYIHRAMPGAAFDLIETGGGAASSTVISPSMFQEFCLPYDTRIHAALHEVGFKVTYHTCGGMMAILDLIWRNGCDASETLSPPGVGGDIRPEDRDTVRETLGRKVALIGGIDQGRLLTDGTPQEVEREVKACFQTFGRDGGYICSASDHFFHAPVENLKAMARAARECGY